MVNCFIEGIKRSYFTTHLHICIHLVYPNHGHKLKSHLVYPNHGHKLKSHGFRIAGGTYLVQQGAAINTANNNRVTW